MMDKIIKQIIGDLNNFTGHKSRFIIKPSMESIDINEKSERYYVELVDNDGNRIYQFNTTFTWRDLYMLTVILKAEPFLEYIKNRPTI